MPYKLLIFFFLHLFSSIMLIVIARGIDPSLSADHYRKIHALRVHNLFSATQNLVSYRRKAVRLVLVRSVPSLRRKATRS